MNKGCKRVNRSRRGIGILGCVAAAVCGVATLSLAEAPALKDCEGVYRGAGSAEARLSIPDSNQPDSAVMEFTQSPGDSMTLYLERPANSDTLRIVKMQRPVRIAGRDVNMTGDESGVDCADVDPAEKQEMSYSLPMRDLNEEWQRTKRAGIRVSDTNMVFISMSGEETLVLNKQEPLKPE